MDARNPAGVKPAATIQPFRPGDTVIVNVKIREGDRERIQAFQGNVIAGSYSQGDSPAPGVTFTVRRVSYGVGVERIFPVCSPMIESVEVVRKGKVRRARLYYMRGLTGRAARIKERRGQLQDTGAEAAQAVPAEAEPVPSEPAAAGEAAIQPAQPGAAASATLGATVPAVQPAGESKPATPGA